MNTQNFSSPDLTFYRAVLEVVDEEVAYAIAASTFQDDPKRKVALIAWLQEKAPLVVIDFVNNGEVYGTSYANEAAYRGNFLTVFRAYWHSNQEAIDAKLVKTSF